MQGSNYALITALYVNTNRGFYHDIYLPIISYAINRLHSQRHGSDAYFTAIEVTDFIRSKFGIEIPCIVIAKSVVLLQERKYNKINLKVFENGNQFQILAVGDDEFENVDEKEIFFTNHLCQIENEFKSYVTNGGYADGVTFVDFISANQENILGYFENEDASVVDEKYATVIFFLKQLRKFDVTLYTVASQLFWGSILAAFLCSSKPEVSATEVNGTSVEYFLDTSIVLGALCLSSSEKEETAKNICTLVRNSKGILRVHPITIEEVKQIISSVETQPAKPFSDIADAIENHNLKVHELAKIRLEIEKRLEQLHISVFPKLSSRDLSQEISKIKGKDIVKRLAESRCGGTEHRANDNFREIHDVFMDAYVSRRELSGGGEVHFVTSNLDLIRFSKNEHQRTNMLSAMDVILRLWMHNSNAVGIEDKILVESIARCMDAHNLNVRNKIAQVAQFYNQNSEGYDEEVYKDFLRNLYVRARHSIECCDKIIQNGASTSCSIMIKSAVERDKEGSDERIRILNKSNVELQEHIVSKDAELEQQHDELKKAVETISQQNDKIISLTTDIAKIELANNKTTTRYDEAAEKIRLYEERDELKDKLLHVKSELEPLTLERKKMATKFHRVLFWGAIIFLAIMVIYLILSLFFDSLNKVIGIIPGSISIVLCVLNISEKYDKWRTYNVYNRWSNKNRFELLTQEIQMLTSKIAAIESKIKKYNNIL